MKVTGARPGCWHLNDFRQTTEDLPPDWPNLSWLQEVLLERINSQPGTPRKQPPHLGKRLRSYF